VLRFGISAQARRADEQIVVLATRLDQTDLIFAAFGEPLAAALPADPPPTNDIELVHTDL
jgi:hypothetical protein